MTGQRVAAAIGPGATLVQRDLAGAPYASQLGLKYVAHVTPPDSYETLSEVAMRQPFSPWFELQIFGNLADAEAWLRQCW